MPRISNSELGRERTAWLAERIGREDVVLVIIEEQGIGLAGADAFRLGRNGTGRRTVEARARAGGFRPGRRVPRPTADQRSASSRMRASPVGSRAVRDRWRSAVAGAPFRVRKRPSSMPVRAAAFRSSASRRSSMRTVSVATCYKVLHSVSPISAFVDQEAASVWPRPRHARANRVARYSGGGSAARALVGAGRPAGGRLIRPGSGCSMYT